MKQLNNSCSQIGPLRRGFFCACVLGNRTLLNAFELRDWSAAMPIFHFLVLAAYALIALLFAANSTLEPRSSPVIVTSQRIGLPESRRPDPIQTITARPAPAVDMTSQAVLAAQPKSVSDDLEKIGSAARAARAEAPSKDRRVTQPRFSMGY